MSEKTFVTTKGDVLVSLGTNEQGDHGIKFSGKNFKGLTISVFLSTDGMELDEAERIFNKASQEEAQLFADEYFDKTAMQIIKGHSQTPSV